MMAVWETIDLGKDSVIEASAGTGKTYTIEHLVGRYLVEKMLPIGKLLLVTFTEKAAGEMKERIRIHLQEKISDDEELTDAQHLHLQEQLDGFDNAAISTIHSFCQSVLREYAFENGQVFDLQLVDEKELTAGVLRDIMRKDWPVWAEEDFGVGLEELLETICSNSKTEDLFQLILKVASQASNCEFAVVEMDEEGLEKARKELKGLSDYPGFAERYRNLNFRSDSRELRAEILSKVDQWLASEDHQDAAKIWELATRKSFFTKNDDSTEKPPEFACLVTPTWLKSGDNHAEVMPELYELAETLQKFREPFIKAYVAARDSDSKWFALCTKTVNELLARLGSVKAEQGLMTYDDMLLRVRDALDPDKNPGAANLVKTLRDRYEVALVDEFQDTDPVQWDIFKKVFHERNENTLIVVGDPKQAIYSFRGADLHTYLKAKSVISNKKKLDENFRSTEELLTAFNALFKTEAWFGSGTPSYSDVSYPGNGSAQVTQAQGNLNRPPIVPVNVGVSASKGGVANMARFAAAEIAAFVGSPQDFRVATESDKNGQPLKYSDFCILLRTRADAAHYERALRNRNIPYSFYKKPGIYQSDEALHIRYMLGLLANRTSDSALKRALMTRFFPVRAVDLDTTEFGVEANIRALLNRWVEFCDNRTWGQLFQSMLSDSGLLFRESTHPDGQRRIANYQQIFEELETVASDESLDIRGLHKLVSQRIAKHVEVDDEADRHRLETEDDTVKIMTMHASKGLEFPVVFIGSKSKTDMRNDKVFCYHENGTRKISLDKEISKPKATQEMLDEQKRLLYVALTRAKYRVYLPYARIGEFDEWEFENEWKYVQGRQPFDALTTNALEQAFGEPPAGLIPYDEPALPQEIDEEGGKSSIQSDKETEKKDPDAQPIEVSFKQVDDLYPYQRKIDSFSSLARHGDSKKLEATVSFADAAGTEVEDEPEVLTGPVESAETTEVNISEQSLLPRGIKTGNVFHDIMEALALGNSGVAFADISQINTAEEMLQNRDLAAVIDRIMARHGLKNYSRLNEAGDEIGSVRQELADMIRHTLNTELPELENSLANVARQGTLVPELEFHFSEGEEYLGEDPQVKDDRRGLLNGFIDLLFEHEGKLYILDWKTNSLDDYGAENINQAMTDADYMLQYRIYALAVLEWLRQSHGDEASEKFGGIFYLFVRGMAEGERQGIYADPWSPDKESEYRDFVLERLRTGQDSRTVATGGMDDE